MPDVVFRCSDGHLFAASRLKVLFLAVHLAGSIFTRCPVDRKWRTAARVHPGSRSEAELDQAKQHRF